MYGDAGASDKPRISCEFTCAAAAAAADASQCHELMLWASSHRTVSSRTAPLAPQNSKETGLYAVTAVLAVTTIALLAGGGHDHDHDAQGCPTVGGAAPAASTGGLAPVCETPACLELANSMLNTMNLTADPCDDFFEYACGNFIVNNPIPDDKSSMSQASKHNQSPPPLGSHSLPTDCACISSSPSSRSKHTRYFHRNLEFPATSLTGCFADYSRTQTTLRFLLENSPASGGMTQSVADFYHSCMDLDAIETVGLDPARVLVDVIPEQRLPRNLDFDQLATVSTRTSPQLASSSSASATKKMCPPPSITPCNSASLINDCEPTPTTT